MIQVLVFCDWLRVLAWIGVKFNLHIFNKFSHEERKWNFWHGLGIAKTKTVSKESQKRQAQASLLCSHDYIVFVVGTSTGYVCEIV